jgi:hypothetical protein
VRSRFSVINLVNDGVATGSALAWGIVFYARRLSFPGCGGQITKGSLSLSAATAMEPRLKLGRITLQNGKADAEPFANIEYRNHHG